MARYDVRGVLQRTAGVRVCADYGLYTWHGYGIEGHGLPTWKQ
jgi:hypothetical protein